MEEKENIRKYLHLKNFLYINFKTKYSLCHDKVNANTDILWK